MKRFYFLSLLISLFLLYSPAKSQQFNNGDLNGTVAISAIPTGWQQVPYGDPHSLSTSTSQATSDVTGWTGPSAGGGICGNPYSGNTFTSGNKGYSSSLYWHEGLMQSVSGFVPGNQYTVSLWQANVKQSNLLDLTGCWMFVLDNTLIGVTAATYSAAPYNSTSFVWEKRYFTFTATSSTHLLKFLPEDDDPFSAMGNDGLRMGIDSLLIRPAAVLASPFVFDLKKTDNNSALLSWNEEVTGEYEVYAIQRASDGAHFETIGRVDANGTGYYTFEDPSLYAGNSWYRILRKDLNGSFTASEVRQLYTQNELNAFVWQKQLTITGDPQDRYLVQIYDLSGRVVWKAETGNKSDISSLSSGAYLLNITVPGKNIQAFNKKVILQ